MSGRESLRSNVPDPTACPAPNQRGMAGEKSENRRLAQPDAAEQATPFYGEAQ